MFISQDKGIDTSKMTQACPYQWRVAALLPRRTSKTTQVGPYQWRVAALLPRRTKAGEGRLTPQLESHQEQASNTPETAEQERPVSQRPVTEDYQRLQQAIQYRGAGAGRQYQHPGAVLLHQAHINRYRYSRFQSTPSITLTRACNSLSKLSVEDFVYINHKLYSTDISCQYLPTSTHTSEHTLCTTGYHVDIHDTKHLKDFLANYNKNGQIRHSA